MKLQNLAVIFIIIILPISVVLANYTANRVQTLRLQISYDEKLDNATADAVEAFQINTFNGDESILANYKIENIEAAVNAFYTSVRTNFSMSGYNNKAIEEFIPAVVFILYDGYYIYSPYQNTWDEETNTITDNYRQSGGEPTYSNGETLFGLKPYVYYSCRYVSGNLDVVITYSLDNYVSIKGTNGSEVIDVKGYLLSGVDKVGDNYTYNGVTISQDGEGTIYENLRFEDVNGDGTIDISPYACRKINGVKWYLSKDESKVFTFLNGVIVTQDAERAQYTPEQIRNNDNAYRYYEEAYNLEQTILSTGLINLETKDARTVDITNEQEAIDLFGSHKIFDELESGTIEEENSEYNSHRMDVIKYSVERNLSVAISNFNNVSSASANFQMPELMPDEWDTVANNITMITFLQGLPIGGKIYNGYSIIANNRNKELVSDDSIYIVTQDGTYHDIRDNDLYDGSVSLSGAIGRSAMDFERETIINDDQTKNYYFPAFVINQTPTVLTGCYGSIVRRENIKDGTVLEVVNSSGSGSTDIKQIYYIALGRERYGLYRPDNDIGI